MSHRITPQAPGDIIIRTLISVGITMVRTVISLDAEDKAWLDQAARSERIPMTKLVRRAIRRLRQEQEAAPQGFERLLRETAGTWKAGDGLAYQRRVRAEWGRAR